MYRYLVSSDFKLWFTKSWQTSTNLCLSDFTLTRPFYVAKSSTGRPRYEVVAHPSAAIYSDVISTVHAQLNTPPPTSRMSRALAATSGSQSRSADRSRAMGMADGYQRFGERVLYWSASVYPLFSNCQKKDFIAIDRSQQLNAYM